jgi:membrane protein
MHLFTKIRRALITLPPVKFVIRESKKIIIPGFNGIPLFDVVSFFFKQLTRTSLTERASSIAFNILLAIPPAFIFLFTLIPFLPVSGFMNEMYALIRDVIPGEKNHSYLISFLEDFTSRQRNDLLSFGIILALFFSSNAMIGIMQSFNKMDYIVVKKRNAFHDRVAAIKLTLILFLLILVSVVSLALRGSVLTWLGVEDPTIRVIIFNARWLVIVLLFFFAISFIYRHAPSVHKKWKLLSPGSILATFMMLAFTMIFSYYVANFGN